ncbi:MAG: ABC transporter permease subunit [Lewinellaceae bacterium]|nr:ABC transporter permease subunit [Saprospiraceae bacterium]MCB9341638.1 ABC transporter permease subunit [Lewinellaceae bacterium]
MHPTWVIAKRELAGYFDSLVAYILLIVFLGLTGLFTWLIGADVFLRKQADLQVFFEVAQLTLLLFIPAITMRQFAEEKRTGTIELLLTKNVTNRQVVLGKFLSCLLMVCIALLFTLPYYITVANLGNLDHGATLCGYLGLILMASAYISIGLFASTITNNQIVAFLLSLFIGLAFHFLFDAIGSGMTGWFGSFFKMLSISNHFDSISRGVIDSKDIFYFATIILLGLFLAEWNIGKRD